MNDLSTYDQLNLPDGLHLRLLEQILDTHDHYNEIMEFGRPTHGSNSFHKRLPYHNDESHLAVQELGHELFYNSLTAKTIHENLISYIVGEGHEYRVVEMHEGTASDEFVDTCQRILDIYTREQNWAEVQEEFYNRWFRSGETIERMAKVGDTFETAFVEPHWVGKPKSPELARRAPFGIEFESNNAKRPARYFIENQQTGNREPEDAVRINFGKRGVDENDPRAIGILVIGYCECREIDSVEYAVTNLAVAVAENAVSYDYDINNTNARDVKQIADGARKRLEDAKLEGKPNDAGRAVHARKFRITIQTGSLNFEAFNEIISGKSRRISTVAGIPEFVITGDADTGSRNSLIQAEAPLIRRVAREANKGSRREVEKLYRAILVGLGQDPFDPKNIRSLKQRIHIQAKAPIPDTKDQLREAQTLSLLLETRAISPQIYTQLLGYSYQDVMKGWEEHEELIQKARDIHGNSFFLDAAQIELKVRAAVALQRAGYDSQKALEAVGLDPIEHRAMLEEETGNAGTRNPNDPRDPESPPGGDPAEGPAGNQAA